MSDGGIGGKIGAAESAGDDDYAIMVQMVAAFVLDVGFGKFGDVEGDHKAGVGGAVPMEGFAQADAVDDGGEHTHGVGFGVVNLLVGLAAPEDIAAADDHGELDIGVCNYFD